jgi:hypothetical protein
MVIVASHLDDSTERMIDFLVDSFGVPVNAVLFQPFHGNLLGRTWLRPGVDASRNSGKRSSVRLYEFRNGLPVNGVAEGQWY